MKKWILVFLLFAIPALAQDELVIPDESLPVVNRAKIDTIIIRMFTKQAIVQVRKGFMSDGQFVAAKEMNVIFANKADNPATPEDETSTEFTDFLATIRVDRQALKELIKAKLGK